MTFVPLPKKTLRALKHGDWVRLAVNPTTASPPVQLIWPGHRRALINHWATREVTPIDLNSVVEVIGPDLEVWRASQPVITINGHPAL